MHQQCHVIFLIDICEALINNYSMITLVENRNIINLKKKIRQSNTSFIYIFCTQNLPVGKSQILNFRKCHSMSDFICLLLSKTNVFESMSVILFVCPSVCLSVSLFVCLSVRTLALTIFNQSFRYFTYR